MANRLTGHDLVNARALMHCARLKNRARRSFNRGRISRAEMERRIKSAERRHNAWSSFYDRATRDRARALDNEPMRHRKGEIIADNSGTCEDCDCEVNLANDDRCETIHVGGWSSDDSITLCRRCADARAEADEPEEIDDEYEHNRRVMEHVSSVCGGLTESEARDILFDY